MQECRSKVNDSKEHKGSFGVHTNNWYQWVRR